MHQAYENTFAFFSSLATQIKTTPGLKQGTKIALVGETDELINNYYEYKDTDKIMGANGVTPNIYSREKFIKYYIGFNVCFADESEVERITKNIVFKKMPQYPYYGSVRVIDDYIVVKFSEEQVDIE